MRVCLVTTRRFAAASSSACTGQPRPQHSSSLSRVVWVGLFYFRSPPLPVPLPVSAFLNPLQDGHKDGMDSVSSGTYMSSGTAGSVTTALAGLRSLVEMASARRWEAREPGEMDLSELRICKRDDGMDWVLGQGTFGTVCFGAGPGLQPSVRVRATISRRYQSESQHESQDRGQICNHHAILPRHLYRRTAVSCADDYDVHHAAG